ncbi:type II CAAX endopeptidase family protein [Alloacidobacterium dinghuense]|uniref:type II CAAX endopeptidase family protein n=1 Tax=Alloacidobacterium dinghuense TaxID=2763107 RepID=UPI001C97AA28|nr:type II CAAX endopeptidase family protein [Alloacidobacterium dinghuense]
MREQNATEISEHATLPAIAPWWHTALLVAPLLAFSLLGSIKPTHQALSQHHLGQYLATLIWEWLLAALVLWGIRMRGTPLRQLLGQRRPTLRDWGTDVALAAAFWIAAVITLAAISVVFKLAHLSTPQKTLAQLAPQNVRELLLWILLSASAGICEELTFRGYLLQQFSRASGRIWIGVLASSLLFGVAHGYEGISGMIAITVYGALFCMLTIARGSLRPGMMAHAWQDIFSGIALMVLKHAHVF